MISSMRSSPGFLVPLQTQLESLNLDTLERVNRPGGLEIRDLLDLILRPRDYSVDLPDNTDPDIDYGTIDLETRSLGAEALRDGSTAYCVLAGGSGTRIGMSKAFLNIPGTATSLLGLKLLQAKQVKDVWVMSSPSNKKEIEDHLLSIGRPDVRVFTQFESFRLTLDNNLHMINGEPDLHPCGHGDVIPALKHAGVLSDFLRSGGKRVVVVNVDNLFAAPDPVVVGQHIAAGKPITCEVTEKLKSDTGGILCRHIGVDQIVEQFRLSSDTDPSQYNWFSTNSMVIDADLNFDAIRWSWHRVKKNVGGQLLVQYERLLQEVTSHFKTQFVSVPRHTRYTPVKTNEDLQAAANLFQKMLP